MEFEWDPAKSAATERLRGIGLDRAAEIFLGRIVQWADDRKDYGETRIRSVGESACELLHVVYTRRGEIVRVISARRANGKERQRWHSFA